MKLHSYISLITLVTACVFFIPNYAYADNNNNDKHKNDNKKGNVQNKHSNRNDNQSQDNKGNPQDHQGNVQRDNNNRAPDNRVQTHQGNVQRDNNRTRDTRVQTHQGNVQNDRGRGDNNRPNVQQNRYNDQNNRPNVQQNRIHVQNSRPAVQYNKSYVHYNGTPTNYQYRGRYRNFRNYNHTNRYYYGGNYYNFDDYWRYYSRESDDVFTYEGAYRRHGNFFIFTDRYGNEFDLYLKPYRRIPMWYHAAPLMYGRPYRIKLRPTRYYATPDEVRIGVNLNFGWGNVSFRNTRYVDMQTAPELINVRGRLYIRD